MEKLDILYVANHDYVDIMLGSIYSVLKNSNIPNITFHIISSGFTSDDYSKIEVFFEKFDNATVNSYSIDNFDIERYGLPAWRGNQIANSLLFFQEIMGYSLDYINQMLYLDADTIVVDDLNGLSEYVGMLNAVRDGCLRTYYNRLGLSNYYNSGVLLINMGEWIDNSCQERIIDFIASLVHKNINIRYPDQDVINCVFDGEIDELPVNYNMAPNMFAFSQRELKQYYSLNKVNISHDEVLEAKKEPIILHALGFAGIKPWSKNHVNPYNEEFLKYIRAVNPNFELQELSLIKKILASSPSLFHKAVLIKNSLPPELEDKVRNLSLKLHQK